MGNVKSLRKLKVKETPDAVRELVTLTVAQHSVTLMGATIGSDGRKCRPIGSGTLVTHRGQHSILTAGHVIKNKTWDLTIEAKPFTHLGLVVAHYEHCTLFSLDKVVCLGEWNLKGSGQGKDFAYIHLPPDGIGMIKGMKSFVNLDNYAVGDDSDHREKLAAIVGTPAEWAKEIVDTEKSHQMWDLLCIVGLGGIERIPDGSESSSLLAFEAVRDEFYRGPKSFRGVSGGGLWVFDISEEEPGEYTLKKSTLAGIPFYEDPHGEESLTIICQDILGILD
jgi:hypothetical protein